jgi:uncharacterized membrane protein
VLSETEAEAPELLVAREQYVPAFGRMLPFLGVAAGTLAVGASHMELALERRSLAVAVAAVEAVGGIVCGIASAIPLVRFVHVRKWRRSLSAMRALPAGRGPAA